MYVMIVLFLVCTACTTWQLGETALMLNFGVKTKYGNVLENCPWVMALGWKCIHNFIQWLAHPTVLIFSHVVGTVWYLKGHC